MAKPALLTLQPDTALETGERDVRALEDLLSQWFEAPIVLTSSGRAALDLAFRDIGLSRYRSALAMPPWTSACVFDAVIRHAFPVDAAALNDFQDADATLVIHQYGHVQKVSADGPLVEDICHAFFATPDSGKRDWLGDYAVFSLPKFFSTSGMVGGLVLRDEVNAARVRTLRDAHRAFDPMRLAGNRRSFQTHSDTLIHGQLDALINPQPDALALGLFPESLAGLRAVGAQRLRNAKALLACLDEVALPADWRHLCLQSLPFAIPVFGPPARLADLAQALTPILADASCFRIDYARLMMRPDYRPAVLLPCHHLLSADDLSQMQDLVSRWTATAL